VCRVTENAASPTTLSEINGILVLIFRNPAVSLLRIIVVPGATVIVIVSTGSCGFPVSLTMYIPVPERSAR
jgi:hypothetical protein